MSAKPLNGKAYRPKQSREPSPPPVGLASWLVAWTAQVKSGEAKCTALVKARTAFAAYEELVELLAGKSFGEVRVTLAVAEQEERRA